LGLRIGSGPPGCRRPLVFAPEATALTGGMTVT
jgi:hypothetical protein